MTRHLRIVRRLARDPMIPRWLRLALLLGLLPIPGPVDDLVVVVVALIIVTFYRHRVVHHYAHDTYLAGILPTVPLDTWGAWS
jgi:hypothetical protein